jgi:hypothetical protein
MNNFLPQLPPGVPSGELIKAIDGKTVTGDEPCDWEWLVSHAVCSMRIATVFSH